MIDLRYEVARGLAGFGQRRGSCLSLFLNLDPTVAPTDAHLSSRITSLVDEARRSVRDESVRPGHDIAQGALKDVDRAASYLENELERTGARGLALYASGLDGVWFDIGLRRALTDAVHVGACFVLGPLVASLERNRPLVFAAVGRDRGSIWRSEHGHAELIVDLTRNGQGQHDQGGWSQARYARSRDREALDHMRLVADALERAVRPGSRTLLAIACIPDQRTTFADLLVPHVREALIGWATIEAHEGSSALQAESERLLESHLADAHSASVARWREGLGRGDRATSSWRETIVAAQDGRIDTLLVTGQTRPSWVCPSCNRGSLVAGACDLDGAPLDPVPGGALELALHGTLATGGAVSLVDDHELEDGEGVGAVLRYPAVRAA